MTFEGGRQITTQHGLILKVESAGVEYLIHYKCFWYAVGQTFQSKNTQIMAGPFIYVSGREEQVFVNNANSALPPC